MTVRKAVIPAAGLGTRFLPATKSQPKEMVPVVDRPGIQYVVEEAARAGIHDILIVTGRGKVSLEDHFDRSPDLESQLERKQKRDELEEVRRVTDLANFFFVRQKEPLGLGHAVLVAKDHIGDEPFAVLLPDEIVPEPVGDEAPLLERMISFHAERDAAAVVAVQEVPREDVSAYGVIVHGEIEGGFTRVSDLVEKPAVEDAPSNLALPGRYIFEPSIFDALERTAPGVGNEIQLTDAIKILAQEEEVWAYVHEGPIYDYGKKIEYLRATIELALRRGDLEKPLLDYLRGVVERSG